MSETALLFDFDDVINIIPNTKNVHVTRSGWDTERWRTANFSPYQILYNEEVVETINELNNVIWLSTWFYDGKEAGLYTTEDSWEDTQERKAFMSSIGFRDFDHLDAFGDFSPGYGAGAHTWWKFQAAEWLIYSGEYSRIVWFDDMLTKSTGKAQLSAIASAHDVEFVGVTVRPSIGLTKEELEENVA